MSTTRASILSVILAPALLLTSATSRAVEYLAIFDQPYLDHDIPFSYSGFNPSVPVPTLTVDFGVDKRLELTYSAPDGMQFDIGAKPSGALTYHFFADIWSTGGVVVPQESPGDTLAFTGASGTAPTLDEHVFDYSLIVGSEHQFHAKAVWDLNGPFSFQAITFTFDIPAAYTYDFTDLTPALVRLWAAAHFPNDYSGPAPAPFMTLSEITAVPEPASLALLSFGLAGFGFARRKKPN